MPESLSPENAALLERRLRAGAPPALQRPRLVRRPDPRHMQVHGMNVPPVFPLSFIQELFWFLWFREPDSAEYNTPLAFRLHGKLDASALERAWGEILRRHAVLRAAFPVCDGRPTQVVRPISEVREQKSEVRDQADLGPPTSDLRSLVRTDLAGLAEGTRETELLRLAQSAVQAPFDLTTGPVFRASLFRLGPVDHVLLIVVHHISFDGWSGRVLRDELARLYAAFSKGQDSPLPPLELDYADYAAWQRQCWDSGVCKADLDYWQEELRGPLPVLELPIAQRRLGTPGHHGKTVSLELDVLQAAELRHSVSASRSLRSWRCWPHTRFCFAAMAARKTLSWVAPSPGGPTSAWSR